MRVLANLVILWTWLILCEEMETVRVLFFWDENTVLRNEKRSQSRLVSPC